MTELTARAVLLDMDGTLVNSDAVVERCWRRWAVGVGLDPEVVLGVVHGRQGHESMALLLPERSMEENLADNAEMLVQETNDTEGVVPVPGAAALLAALNGLPHALVTSANVPLMRTRMSASGLPLPDVLVTAESVSASKPHPEGFLKGAAELGFSPQECVVFEDAPAGIAAAHAAGMRVVGVGPRAATGPLTPAVTVRDLEQVLLTADADTGLLRLAFRH
ncbi:HAD family hydrolase [Wenjunlia vitaminophila]|uniref:HAD family hydrolase n=1 Tax=Wenjunlia vitaminophila TaxID=76728 RepID=A0A0T6LL67_WENVI|nr:HAD-IA family hydrolase [Wenjunlia vitaminophila]KRV46588.1 HAD family hydrolase [Wenjunlia vitaminophila]